MPWPQQQQQQAPAQPAQVQPQTQHTTQYGLESLPGQGAPQQNGPQPGVPGAQIVQPYYPGQPQGAQGAPQQPWQGAPMQQGNQQQPLQPQQQQPWQPQQAPQQPQWPAQYQGAPQQPQQPQQAGRVQLNDQTILDGESVPPELRGRSFGEVRRLYTALSTDWLRRNGQAGAQTPAQQTPQSQGYGVQPPQGQAPQQAPWGGQHQQQGAPQGAQQGASQFEQRIAQSVGQMIDQRLAPVLQQTQAQAILQAREVAKTGMADFAYLEPDIMQIVSGAPPEALQDPRTWQLAARAARGARVEQGTYQPQAQAQQQVPGQQRTQTYGPGVSQPAQPMHSFFTEGPTAPSIPGYAGSQGPRAPTQEDYFYAQKWQMDINNWMAWKYGQGQEQGQQAQGRF